MVYTLPRAIKEEKKIEERVGHSRVEKEKGEVGQVGSLEETRESKERDVDFLVKKKRKGREVRKRG